MSTQNSPYINAIKKYRELFLIEYDIYCILLKLYALEVEGKKHWKSYQTELEKLKLAINKEETFLEELSKDIPVYYCLIDFTTNSNEQDIELQKPDNSIKHRIRSGLLNHRPPQSPLLETIMPFSKEDQVKYEFMSNLNLLGTKFMREYIEDETARTDEVVEPDSLDEYNRMREKLLLSLYLGYFETPRAVKMLSEEFSEPEETYFFSGYQLAFKLGLSQETAQEIVDSICLEILENITEICYKGLTSNSVICNIKAARAIMSTDCFEQFKRKTKQYIDVQRAKLDPKIDVMKYVQYDYVLDLLSDESAPKIIKNPYTHKRIPLEQPIPTENN